MWAEWDCIIWFRLLHGNCFGLWNQLKVTAFGEVSSPVAGLKGGSKTSIGEHEEILSKSGCQQSHKNYTSSISCRLRVKENQKILMLVRSRHHHHPQPLASFLFFRVTLYSAWPPPLQPCTPPLSNHHGDTYLPHTGRVPKQVYVQDIHSRQQTALLVTAETPH